MHLNTHSKTRLNTPADIDALIAQAWACREGDLDAGLARAELAVAAAEACLDQRRLAQALAALGYFLLRLRRTADAQACLRRGLEMSRAGGDPAAEADCLYRLGEERAAAEAYSEALDFYLQAVRLYDAQENRFGQAESFSQIGGIYNILDDAGQAVHFHLQAFRVREEMEDKEAVACSLNNIGNVYGRAEDFANSVQYHERCLAASRENGQPRLEAMCLGNLSIGYTGLGRLPEAVAAGKAALVLAQEQGSFDKQCYALLSIGRACDKEQKHAEAVEWYLEAVTLARQSNSRRNECEAQIALGGALVAAGRILEACDVFMQAEAAASALGLTQLRAEALSGLAETCERRGDASAALAYHKEFHALEKSLFRAAADKRRQTLMIQMEVEKAQKESQVHLLKNVELAALNAALEDANQALQAQAKELQAQAKRLKAQGDELQRQAAEDGLTGLANRRQLESQLAHRFAEARRSRRSLSVAMADVDHFKQINDRFGHQIGDEVLMSIGLLLRRACRAEDLAARYGGEEFVLVLPETDLDGASCLCERLRRAVEEHPWRKIHPRLSVTVSMGLSENGNAPSYERLLSLADAQLYEAKHAGRNRVFPAVPAGLTLQ